MVPKIRGFLNRVLGCVCIALMGAMTLAVIIAVFCRYVFALSTIWTEELITMLFISTTYIGCALATGGDEHISINFFSNARPKLVDSIRVFVSLIVIVTQCLVARAALNWVRVAGNVPTPGFGVNYGWFYSFLPVCAVLVCLYEALNIIERTRSLLSRESSK